MSEFAWQSTTARPSRMQEQTSEHFARRRTLVVAVAHFPANMQMCRLPLLPVEACFIPALAS
eukprot:4311966-Amphidinium_carterae.1